MITQSKVIITNLKTNLKWDKKWIYLGRDFINILQLNVKYSAQNRISTTSSFKKYFEENKLDYLNWIDKQRLKNNDSLNWWMSHLAGRNNMCSFLYEHICQINSIQFHLDEYKRENNTVEILIICENYFLSKTLKCLLEKRTDLQVNYLYNKFDVIKEVSSEISYVLFEFITRIKILIIQKYISNKKPKKNNFINVNKKVFLIHQCLDDKSFNSTAILYDRYFKLLPQWIADKNYQIVTLPWKYNISLSNDIYYTKLRETNTLVIEDHLNVFNYLNAIYNYILCIFTIDYKITYKGLDIKYLLKYEQILIAKSTSIIRFWLNGIAIRKWGKYFKDITYIDTFELMPPEHSSIYFLKQLNANITTIGYMHSIVSRDFLGYWSTEIGNTSKILPDWIITNGTLSKNFLTNQGYDPIKLIDGPAIRQNYLKNTRYTKESNTILLLCPYDISTACEAIYKLNSSIKNTDYKHFKIQVKSHPMMNKNDILKLLPENNLPNNWIWNDQEINDALTNVYCCITLSSASIYDAIINDCIVISIQRELSSMGNFADNFCNEFEVIKEINSNEILQRLNDIFFLNIKYYKEQFFQLKQMIINGLNPTNEINLNKFLK